MKTCKRILASLIVAVMVLTAAPLSGFVGMKLNLDWFDFNTKASAASYSGTCGTYLTWRLDTETGELVISGTGVMFNYSYSYSSSSGYITTAPWRNYVSSIKNITIEDGVTSIGNRAFYNCTRLTGVIIPDSVTSIGYDAFYGCDITHVNYNGTYEKWNTVNIGSGNSRLLLALKFDTDTDKPFYNKGVCGDNLEWTLYADGTFVVNGTGLMTNYTTENLAPWHSYKSAIKTVNFGEGITRIGNDTFLNCENLISVSMPDTVTRIGNTAFRNCINLMTISFSNKLTNLGYYAFYGCSSLTTIAIPNGVTTIGNYAFANCTGLTTVTIPETVTSIASDAFSQCSEIRRVLYSGTGEQWEAISIAGGNEALNKHVIVNCNSDRPYYAPGNCGENLKWILYTDGELVISGEGEMDYYTSSSQVPWSSLCPLINSVTITDGVTSIGSYVFKDCVALSKITMPDGITSIGTSAFEGCTGLTSIIVPESVTSIGSYAFKDCAALSKLTMPDGITSIGTSAFKGCTGLTSIIVPESVTSIGSYAFSGCIGLTDVTIKGSVTNIGSSVFSGCDEMYLTLVKDSPAEVFAKENNITYYYYYDGSEDKFISLKVTSKLSFEINKETYTMTVDCVGNMFSFANDAPPWSQYEPYIKHIIVNDGCTNISENAFKDFDRLETIVLAESIKSIDSYAFSNSGLINISIPDSVTSIGTYAFNACDNLTCATIGSGVTQIASYTFYGCTALVSVTIPEGLTSIGYASFYNCVKLMSITIPDSVTKIGYYAFYNCESITSVTIGNSLKSIGDFAFRGCTGLVDIVIPESVTSIGDNAFRGCVGLTNVIIPDSVTDLGVYAFYGCSEISKVIIGDSVTRIGEYTFYDCRKLTSISIGNAVTNIDNYAFYNCSGIRELTMPISAKIYNSSYTFYNCINIKIITLTRGDGTVQDYGTSTSSSSTTTYYGYTPWYSSRKVLEELTFEGNITSIGSSTFREYVSLANITIGDSVTSIGDSAFEGCANLTSVTIGDGVTSIGDSAFEGCINLTSITIGNSVTSIGDSAFYGCSSLGSLALPATVQSIGNNTFSGCQKVKKLTVYNRNCTFGTNCTGYYTTIVGYTGSTAEAYADEMGFDFELISYDDHEHIYSNSCDAECNVCGYVNPDAGHTYINDCDPECDVCGYTRTELIHTYTNDCDPDCDVCGYTRTELIHTYTNDCDPDCDICGNVRSNLNHTDDNSDGICDVCENALSDILIGFEQNFKVKVGETVYIKFVPSNSGIYTFYSSSSTDTYGYVYDSNKNTLASDDDGGSGNNFSITYTFKAGTVYYLGVRYYSSSNSGEIPVTIRLDELICDHINTHIDHKDSTCTETGYDKVICDDCGNTVSTTVIPTIDHSYKTITAEPTCVDEGVVVCLCGVCRYAYISEILDPLGHSELVWKTVVAPTTRREGTMNHICPACDEVFDTKTIPAITLSGNSTANVDFETNTITGFDSGSTSIDDYLSATNNGYTFTCDSATIGTGTVITLTNGEDLINEYEAVIFGDVNGDSWYDGQDAIIVDCLANGMLTQDDVSEAVYMAADCNHDGVIDQLDVALLNEAGTLLANVDQSKPAEVLLETSSAYVEYLDLIDQSFEIEVEDETDVETEETPETDAEDSEPVVENSIFAFFSEFIAIFEKLFNFILGFVNV